MIYELKQGNRSLLSIDCRSPEVLAIIEGNNPGWVFVDDPDAPGAALVWAQGIKGFFLVGDPDRKVFLNELDLHIDRVLKPRLRNLDLNWFEISGGEGWDSLIKGALSKRDLESSLQWVYTLKTAEQKSLAQPELGDGCKLLRIDPLLLANLSVSDKRFLFSKLTCFWGSVDTFLNTGTGYVLMEEDRINSLCFSGFVARSIHAIDIETVQSQRRKGYGETVARAFLAECIEKHIEPYWDCMAENIASARLAEKLGFTRSYVYNLYSFSLQS